MPVDPYPEDLSAGDPALEEALSGVTATAGLVIAGDGVPQIAAVIGPPALDGVIDPWRYDPDLDVWYSPVYAVTWVEGDEIPAPGGDLSWDATDALSTWAEYVNGNRPASLTPEVSGALTATSDGVGLLGVYLPNDPPVSPQASITALMGSDITIGAVHVFPPDSDAVPIPGPDGGYYMDVTDPSAPVIYGPKADGQWGDGTPIGG